MGKRKSRKAPTVSRKKEKLDTKFDCPFCNHEKAVTAKMDFDVKIGTVSCTLCEASYETKIHLLSEPIDVFSDWVDECERLNNEEDDGSYD